MSINEHIRHHYVRKKEGMPLLRWHLARDLCIYLEYVYLTSLHGAFEAASNNKNENN